MPKACPYVIIRFLFVLSVNLNSKYWFFAEGEMFFYVFVSVPQYFSTEPQFLLSTEKGGRGWSPFWIGIGYVSVITLVRIRTLVGHQDRLRLEVGRLDDHRGRLEEVRLGQGRRHGHPIGSFGWAGCPLRMW